MTRPAAARNKPRRRSSPRRMVSLTSAPPFSILLLTALLWTTVSGGRPTFAAVEALASPSGVPERGGSNESLPGEREPDRRKKRGREYNYFAYGSNMCPATVTALRGLNPLASTAAVLPDHDLRFNVPGTPLIEPSWASVEPSEVKRNGGDGDDDGDSSSSAMASPAAVHGALYRLTEDDFASVLRSELVPLIYSVHRCNVVPYRGDGRDAGDEALRSARRTGTPPDDGFVPAYTLRAARKSWRSPGTDVAPSRSYLTVLIRGAEEFGLDASYVDYLRSIEAGPTPLSPGGDGMTMAALEAAEAAAARANKGPWEFFLVPWPNHR